MTNGFNEARILVAISLLGALLLGACQGGQITIDIPSGDGGNSGEGSALSSQTFFILLIVLLVAMFAMVFVAMSSR